MTNSYADPADAPWALLARHLASETTAAERAELRAWVQTDPLHLQILTTVTRAWERAGEVAAAPVLFSPAEVQDAWRRLQPKLAAARPAAVSTPAPSTQNKSLPPAASPAPTARPIWPLQRRVAARRRQLALGLVLVLGVGVALAQWLLPTSRPQVQTFASTTSARQVRLPDGSMVWLNAHSRLHYAGSTGNGPRAVQLTGEAYVEVDPNSSRPFVVTTTTARVRATGTAFNVRAYAAEDSVEVSVARGQVWLARLGAADSVLLPAGTRAALRATDAPGRTATQLRRTPLADHNFRAWQTDTLRFADVPLAQVARTLRATFGTRVQLGSAALAQCRFTGTFAHPKPEQVLTVVAAATASQLVPDGPGSYRLQGPGCPPPAAQQADSATVNRPLGQ
ncbi:DUF4974 domain-containing protein [Hymenobacter gummosus]|uniref:DUF4974 domain-containing protein n=1 Tax=Hymenobacter gummosus TaxID=1776032 RepID=A0A3S0HCX3_9BACT|nr:FecR domain-containing protein [Hymenobacter gummosus]RTQ53718.1 DUF4974 domain-containing protein [Hymenobacter gummosus]